MASGEGYNHTIYQSIVPIDQRPTMHFLELEKAMEAIQCFYFLPGAWTGPWPTRPRHERGPSHGGVHGIIPALRLGY